MTATINLCTSILPAFSFQDVLEIARASGYQGIELRVDDQYHQRLDDLDRDGVRIRRELDRAGLQIPVLSSYIALDDQRSIDVLLRSCQRMDIPKARVVVPRSCRAAVARQAHVQAVVPSYDAHQQPCALLDNLRATLERLERQAAGAGVQVLLELHWGTVMSSFSSAYWLLRDLNPAHVGLTFDPANMLVEGKEDWEFGLKLIQPYLANVHVKNVRWYATDADWEWAWTPLTHGMVDWPILIALLQQNQYAGDYAIEDFLTPNTSKPAAIAHLSEVHTQFRRLIEEMHNGGTNTWPVRPSLVPA